MSKPTEFRVMRMQVRADHAKTLRIYVTKAMRALPRDRGNLEVHLLLQEMANKIDEAFEAAPAKVVALRPNQPEPPEAA